MRKAATFFKFDNKDFYKELKEVTQNLEDYLSDSCNRLFEHEEQAEVYKELGERTMKVYSCINDYYLGL